MNEYDQQAPQVAGEWQQQRRPTRWRLIPALMFAVLGGVMTLVGLWTGAMILKIVYECFFDPELMDYSFNDATRRNFLIFMPTTQLGWGLSWVYASVGFWRCRWIRALVAVGGGVLCMALNNAVEIPL